MTRSGRLKQTWAIWAALLCGGILPSHCSTTVEDAVLDGVSIVITDATAGLLRALLPFDLGDGFGGHGGGGDAPDDPFTGPPVQT